MRCGEKLPQQLANAIFTSPQSANHAQYVDAPYTRPHNYAVYPFHLTTRAAYTHLTHEHDPDCDHCVQSTILRAQLDPLNTESYTPQVHRSFMRALRGSKAFVERASDGALEPYDNPAWVDGEFTVDCLSDGSEVIRHQHEGSWTNHKGARWLPNPQARGTDTVQDYLFAIPCDAHAATMEGEGLGSGVPMSCSSVYHSRLPFPLPQVFRLVHHWPPVYDTEHVAYGFVYQWVRVRHGPVQAVIARVGILSSEKSKYTFNRTCLRRYPGDEQFPGRASVVPPEARQDLFVAGQYILQRVVTAQRRLLLTVYT